jgi:acetolactate synthase-1/3 small subunit
VPVHKVHDLTAEGRALERVLAVVKVAGTGEPRAEALRLADAYRAQIVDATTESFVFEITGKPSKIDTFIAIMVPLGMVEVVRTGLAAIGRGAEGM